MQSESERKKDEESVGSCEFGRTRRSGEETKFSIKKITR
jgi:hypothetical protein